MAHLSKQSPAKGGQTTARLGGSVYDRKLKKATTQHLRILKDQLAQIRMNAYASEQEKTKLKTNSD